MLQPRETDLPSLFLVLVVLPLVAYILLGKWSEVANKKGRISKHAQIAAEEAFRAEAMAASAVMPAAQIPVVHLSINGIHECVICSSPATTRCSRCKSVRYCSGKCQILHWRQVHKHECQNLEYNGSYTSSRSGFSEDSFHENVSPDESMELHFSDSNVKQTSHEKIPSDDRDLLPELTVPSATGTSMSMEASGLMMNRKSIDKRGYRRSHREILNREDGDMSKSAEEASENRETCSTSYNSTLLKDTLARRHKFKESYPVIPKEGISERIDANIPGWPNGCAMKIGFGTTSSIKAARVECSSERISMKRSHPVKAVPPNPKTKMHKSVKSVAKGSRDQSCSDMEERDQIADDLKDAKTRDNNPAQGGNGVANIGFMKMIGLMRSSKHHRLEESGI